MDSNLKEIIRIINEENLQNNIILIGSWAELFYEDLIRDYYSQFSTNDYDFLIKRPVRAESDFIGKMKQSGFSYTMDYITSKSRFYKDGMEVEFLTNLNKEMKSPFLVKPLRIYAESLGNLDILLNNTITVEVDDCRIQIPAPQAYCLHKLLINPSREEWKKQKDIDSVVSIFARMIKSDVFIDETKELYCSLSKKQKKTIDAVCEKYGIIELNHILNSR